MAYRIKGTVRIDDSANANLGIVTATELVGRISSEAITSQTDGAEGDVSGADEVLIYDNEAGELLRVEVDEFVAGSGIGTVVSDFDNLNVTGVTTTSGVVVSGDLLGVTEAILTNTDENGTYTLISATGFFNRLGDYSFRTGPTAQFNTPIFRKSGNNGRTYDYFMVSSLPGFGPPPEWAILATDADLNSVSDGTTIFDIVEVDFGPGDFGISQTTGNTTTSYPTENSSVSLGLGPVGSATITVGCQQLSSNSVVLF